MLDGAIFSEGVLRSVQGVFHWGQIVMGRGHSGYSARWSFIVCSTSFLLYFVDHISSAVVIGLSLLTVHGLAIIVYFVPSSFTVAYNSAFTSLVAFFTNFPSYLSLEKRLS